MWLEYVNSIACAVLLASMLPVAVIIDPRRNPYWVLLMLAVETVFCLQIIGPWTWMPIVSWPTALLHTMQAGCVLMLRHRFMLFVRIQFEPPPAVHPVRRLTDYAGREA